MSLIFGFFCKEGGLGVELRRAFGAHELLSGRLARSEVHLITTLVAELVTLALEDGEETLFILEELHAD